MTEKLKKLQKITISNQELHAFIDGLTGFITSPG